MTQAQTVRGAVAEREDQDAEVQSAEDRVKKSRAWFDKVVPDHINADRFVALCIGALRKDAKLMQAATLNPGPFMVAASECARLGLTPGVTYHFAAFKNRETGLSDVTGIVDYKGEIEMIYRSGMVSAVHCQVVRAADEFLWRPAMVLPHHVIKANEAGQVGLSDEGDRGPLTGVYAYATLLTGGYSDVIVMARSEVMKHKAAAKTKTFWDGVWEPDMWLKTALHKLYDRVPHSAEYVKERQRVAAVPPLPVPAPRPAVAPPDVPALAGPDPAPPAGVAEQTPHERVQSMFAEVGIGTRSKTHAQTRAGVIAIMAAENPVVPLDLDRRDPLDPAQLARLASNLEAFISEARDAGQDPKAELEKLALSAVPA
jgi:recombination protein RecT